MIKRICDCCGAEVKKNFVKFYITWSIAEARSGELSEGDHTTPYLEYCETCFDNLRDELGLVTDRITKEKI